MQIDTIRLELDLDRLVERQAAGLSAAGRKTLLAEVAQWRAGTEAHSNLHADTVAEGGSMRPMLYSACLADETEYRMRPMMQAQSASPGSG